VDVSAAARRNSLTIPGARRLAPQGHLFPSVGGTTARFVSFCVMLTSTITNASNKAIPATQPTSAVRLNVSVQLLHGPPDFSPFAFLRLPSMHSIS
jgi:hypothetical protein